jgi:DNA-binding transcriptional MerR regulator
MAERTHLSIGEVLSLLREEFPDVTISKIRFLESQGLVDPERTPSGYRKFYEQDVERLRWILRQQREHFLPLKVIRGRLGDSVPDDTNGEGEPELPVEVPAAPAARASANKSAPEREPAKARALPVRTPSLFADKPQLSAKHPAERAARRSGQPPAAAAREAKPASPSKLPPASAARRSASPRAGPPALGLGEEADSYTADELAVAAAATLALVTELEQFGLISARAVVAGVPYFDDMALSVTRTAAEFANHGVEVRHLRTWRNAADREADLFQQIVLPLLRQRNPQARHQASETLNELARLGGELRAALMGRAVRDIR